MTAHEFSAAVTAQRDQTNSFLFSARTRGIINKLRIVQTSGALLGFSYCVYNTRHAAPVGVGQGYAADAVLYQVSPNIVVESGKSEFSTTEGFPEDGVYNLNLGYAILDDRDGNPLEAKSSDVASKLVVVITPVDGDSGQPADFAISMTIFAPIL